MLPRRHRRDHVTRRLVGDLSNPEATGSEGDGVRSSTPLCACVFVCYSEYCTFHVSSEEHEFPVRRRNGQTEVKRNTFYPTAGLYIY